MEGQKSEVTVISPPAYVTAAGQVDKQQTTSRSSTVKFVVIGVTAVCITAIVVVGFILGFHYSSKTATHLAKKEYQTMETDGVKQIIEKRDEFTKLYTVRTETETYEVLYDFNKNIMIMKKQSHCVVVPMNSTEVDPEIMSERDAESKEEMTVYKRDNVPIRDTSLLGSAGEDLCEGDLVYWGFPDCHSDIDFNLALNSSTGLPVREKRAVTGAAQERYALYCCYWHGDHWHCYPCTIIVIA
jgi:hypothetical protein